MEFTEKRLKEIAIGVAVWITESARMSGDDPIAWITNNASDPWRSWPAMESIFQSDANSDGELFDAEIERIKEFLAADDVHVDFGPDGSMYAVDLTRFESVDEDPRNPHATLQEDWRMYNSGTIH